MKKTYVTPDIEILALTETECHEIPKTPKEILSSTGDIIGYEKVENKCTSFNNQKSSGWGFWGWFPKWW